MLNRWIVNCIKFHDGDLHHNAGNTFTTSKLCVDILYRRNTQPIKNTREIGSIPNHVNYQDA